MNEIDLSKMPVREGNELLRKMGEDGITEADILNPDARHHVGVGLVAPMTVRVHGSAGYFCAGLTDGARFEIENNVGWGLGDNIYNGTVIVGGNAGAIAGVAIRGAEIVIKGNMGSRSGQVMKAGTLLCCGNANFMAGYMMYGGRIIILGNSGERLGEDMTSGDIYVAGKVQSLGSDAEITDMAGEELDSIMEYLDRHEISFKGHVPEGRQRRQAPALRHVRAAGALDPVLRLFGQDRLLEHQGPGRHLHQVADRPLPDPRLRRRARPAAYVRPGVPQEDRARHPSDPEVADKVQMYTEIGGINGAKPLKLSMPVMIAPMSYGALSASTKRAIGMASTLSGIAENTGEGGMSDAQRDAAEQLIFQCLGGRLGWNIHDMKRANGLEIYISQGAKPGLGGQLMAKKVTPELAAIRGIPARHRPALAVAPPGHPRRRRPRHQGPGVPRGDRLQAARLGQARRRAACATTSRSPPRTSFDFVELDGMQGSTGAGSAEVLEYVGIPTLAAIIEAIEALEEIESRDKVQLVLMGGLRDGIDAVKALCLGADAVAFGTATIIAGGCIACMQCHVGQCVTGIATQDPAHESRYKPDIESQNIHRFFESVRWQIAAITQSLGYDDVTKLGRDDLVALTPEAAAITGLPYEPEHRDRTDEIRIKAS